MCVRARACIYISIANMLRGKKLAYITRTVQENTFHYLNFLLYRFIVSDFLCTDTAVGFYFLWLIAFCLFVCVVSVLFLQLMACFCWGGIV